jgi:glyoxylate/hydroxypyruvate reductase
MTFLLKSETHRGQVWHKRLEVEFPELEIRVWPNTGDPLKVRYLACWVPPDNFDKMFPNLELLISVGAGVDQIDLKSLPASVTVVRMAEPGLVSGMVEYGTLAVLAAHRNLIDYGSQQRDRVWESLPPVAAKDRAVGCMGLGMLGTRLIESLRPFGFKLSGWSRSAKHIEGVSTFVGRKELTQFLSEIDILVCLLPLTHETRGILNFDLFNALPAGASLINVGRGAHLVEQDLLNALTTGRLRCAILDVTSVEPLPTDHPFWTHPQILLTPHVASVTDAEGGADFIVDSLRRHVTDKVMIGAVDKQRGY